MLLGIRRVDEAAEQLVVTRRRKTEVRADGLLFGARVSSPLRLEFEDGAVAVAEGHVFTLAAGGRLARVPLHGRAKWVEATESFCDGGCGIHRPLRPRPPKGDRVRLNGWAKGLRRTP